MNATEAQDAELIATLRAADAEAWHRIAVHATRDMWILIADTCMRTGAGDVLEHLADAAKDETLPGEARLEAINALLDLVYGAAPEADHSDDDNSNPAAQES